MKDLNNICLTGRLGRDFELRHTPSGNAVTENALAVSDGFGDTEKTIWIPITIWGKTAETAAQYLGKGQKVMITGRMDQETWVDKNSGENRHKLKVTVSQWGFGEAKAKEAKTQQQDQQHHQSRQQQNQEHYQYQQQKVKQQAQPAVPETEDDIPF